MMMRELTVIRLFLTVIWVFFNVVLFYMAYAVVVGKIDKFVWIGVALIATEGAILPVFKNVCPLTILARRYSNYINDTFYIYIPAWLARYNKLIYTTLFIIMMFGMFLSIFIK